MPGTSREWCGSQLWFLGWALLCIMTTWQFTKGRAGRSRSTHRCRGPSAWPCAVESASTSSISAARPGFCLHWRPPSPRSAEGENHGAYFLFSTSGFTHSPVLEVLSEVGCCNFCKFAFLALEKPNKPRHMVCLVWKWAYFKKVNGKREQHIVKKNATSFSPWIINKQIIQFTGKFIIVWAEWAYQKRFFSCIGNKNIFEISYP